MMALMTSCASHGSWQTRLTSDDPAERIRAVKHITDAGDIKLASHLVTCLEDEDTAVRFYAIMGLERLTGDRRGYTYHGTRKERVAAVNNWQKYLIEIGVTPKPTTSATASPDITSMEGRAATQVQEEDKKENG